MDRIVRGISKNARFFLLDTTEVVKKAQEIHQCTPGAIATFGRFLTAGLIMGATLKGDDLLTLRTTTDGLVGQMLLTVDPFGNIKGYLENPNAILPAVQQSYGTLSDFLGKGTLTVIKDMGLKEPYSGLSEMKSGDMANDLAYYYFVSEQVPSVISLGVSFTEEGEIDFAGGYMVQLLPDSEESFIAALEEKIKIMRNFTDLRKGGMNLERILKLIYEDINDENHKKLIENYEILEEKKIQYSCNCTRDKFYNGVISLGKKQIDEVMDAEGKLEVSCHFCKKTYEFKKCDFEKVFN
jgi:molecular chaperone Hsp33